MNTRNKIRNISLAGIVASLALAGVVYLINIGTHENHGPTWCVFGFAVLEYIAWQYLFFCVSRCPGPGEEGNKECVNRCFLIFIFVQLLLIIALLTCLLITGPKW